jgi:hypothetical protein
MESCQSKRQWPARYPEVPIHCVCENCNNGWMSQLENETKPILNRMLSDARFALPLVGQHVVTCWAIKTAMVFEAFNAIGERFYSQAERSALRVWNVIPTHSRVWAARIVEHPHVRVVQNSLGVATSQHDTRGFATTIAFGGVALQILTVRPKDERFRGTISVETMAGPWDEVAVQLWPASHDALEWPGQKGLLGEAGLQAFEVRHAPQNSHDAE